MVSNFHAKEKTVEEILFGTNSLFRIPEYQRPYTRGLDEANDFWNDVVEDNDEAYFLGSFVLNKHSETERINIIDGQQRTLTITIFISVIRDIFKDLGEHEVAEEIQRDYICKTFKLKGTTEYKIIPGDSTKEYFQKIQNQEIINNNEHKEKLTKESKLLKTIYNFFKDKIYRNINFSEKDYQTEYLKNILEKILNSQCIEIVVNDESMAYSIFESVNARGANLSVADLVKNIFFKKYDIDTGDLSEAKFLRKKIENNINECGGDISGFLRHYRMARYSYISKKDLFKKIKQQIETGDYKLFLKDLVETSSFYKIILNPYNFNKEDLELPIRGDHEREDEKEISKIFQSLLGIGVFRIKQYAPIFLSIFKNYLTLVSYSRPTNIIENLERFGYTFFGICSQPARAMEKECSRFAIDIWKTCIAEDEKNIHIVLQQAYSLHKDFLKRNFPSFSLFEANFFELTYNRPYITKYTLQKISNEMEKEHSVDDIIDYTKTNIEHILPQKPELRGLTVDDIKGYVDSIGNLTLIGVRMNSKVGNKILKEKTEDDDGFKKSTLAMTKKLVEQFRDNDYKWNREEIEKRTQELCRKIYDIQTIK